MRALLLALLLLPGLAMADELPRGVPSDADLTQRKIQALEAEMAYAQALINRLTAELASSERRGQWAVNKLWQMPEPAK